VDNARVQNDLNAFNKEFREAHKDNNQAKVERLQKMQPQILVLQNKMMWSQMKPMIFTMFVAILIWRWLFTFMHEDAVWLGEGGPAISVIWGPVWPLNSTADWCIVPSPAWLLIYIILSVSTGQVLQRGLKVMEFRGELDRLAKKRDGEMQDRLSEVRSSIDAAKDIGVPATPLQKELTGVERAVKKGDLARARRLLEGLRERIEDLSNAQVRAMKEVEVATTVMETARKKGASVESARSSLQKANAMLKKGDPTSAIAYAKEAKTSAKESRETLEDISRELGEVGVLVIDRKEAAFDPVRDELALAKQALAQGDYRRAREFCSLARELAERMSSGMERCRKGLNDATSLTERALKAGISVPDGGESLQRAREHFDNGDFLKAQEALDRIRTDLGAKLKDQEEYLKELSGAELVLAKAGSVVDVSAQTRALQEAKARAARGEFGAARDIALSIQQTADAAHKQAVRKARR